VEGVDHETSFSGPSIVVMLPSEMLCAVYEYILHSLTHR
jgi:hypothetical protein